MRADQLFVFAGAGASVGPPAGLPLFDAIRRNVLVQALGTSPDDVASEVAPERFMQALHDRDIDVDGYLRAVLATGSPNAVHRALGELATRGARIWTVNFDTLIEQSAPGVVATAWPDQPDPAARICKPHGSAAGDMIFMAEDVLHPLRRDWYERLASDVAGRVAVFIGYAARDIDLVPVWDDVLAQAAEVVWFAMPGPEDVARVERMLKSVVARGTLRMRVAQGPGANASRDFVDWLAGAGLVAVDPALYAALPTRMPERDWPPLTGPVARAVGGVREALNDIGGARRSYLRRVLLGPARKDAVASLAALQVNHGGSPTAAALWFAARVPVSRIAAHRPVIERKRVTILANRGKHDAVLRATSTLDEHAVSPLLTLRTASLRVADSLDDAVATGQAAVSRATSEAHAVRRAHAAFQLAMALMWAGRIDDADAVVADRLRPVAGIAASRWVAWADFVTGCVAIHQGRPADAVTALDRALRRFTAEGLGDGMVSTRTALLTAYRLAGDDAEFRRTRADLARRDPGIRVHYTRRHAASRAAVTLEDAEFAGWHGGDVRSARRGFASVARSRYPVHAAMGRLGLARAGVDPAGNAGAALALARSVGAAKLADEADSLLRGGPARELFLP